MSRLFSIIGDSNIRRNMTGLNIASRDSMKTAQVIDCASLIALDAAFQEVRAESEVLILATITDFLISGGNGGTIFSTIDPVLATFTTKLLNFVAFRPNLQVSTSVASIYWLKLSTLFNSLMVPCWFSLPLFSAWSSYIFFP